MATSARDVAVPAHALWLLHDFEEGAEYSLFEWDAVDAGPRRGRDVRGIVHAASSLMRTIAGRPALTLHFSWDGGAAVAPIEATAVVAELRGSGTLFALIFDGAVLQPDEAWVSRARPTRMHMHMHHRDTRPPSHRDTMPLHVRSRRRAPPQCVMERWLAALVALVGPAATDDAALGRLCGERGDVPAGAGGALLGHQAWAAAFSVLLAQAPTSTPSASCWLPPLAPPRVDAVAVPAGGASASAAATVAIHESANALAEALDAELNLLAAAMATLPVMVAMPTDGGARGLLAAAVYADGAAAGDAGEAVARDSVLAWRLLRLQAAVADVLPLAAALAHCEALREELPPAASAALTAAGVDGAGAWMSSTSLFLPCALHDRLVATSPAATTVPRTWPAATRRQSTGHSHHGDDDGGVIGALVELVAPHGPAPRTPSGGGPLEAADEAASMWWARDRARLDSLEERDVRDGGADGTFAAAVAGAAGAAVASRPSTAASVESFEAAERRVADFTGEGGSVSRPAPGTSQYCLISRAPVAAVLAAEGGLTLPRDGSIDTAVPSGAPPLLPLAAPTPAPGTQIGGATLALAPCTVLTVAVPSLHLALQLAFGPLSSVVAASAAVGAGSSETTAAAGIAAALQRECSESGALRAIGGDAAVVCEAVTCLAQLGLRVPAEVVTVLHRE